jgi:AhpD family alkylhydroperoxidase
MDKTKMPHGIYKAMFGLEKYVNECGLEPALLNLARLRASQLNGCAYCIDMHSKDLRAAGESEQRIYELGSWRDTPFYSDREQAALAWAEAVTLLTDGHVPDEVYEQARSQFSEKELADLTLAIISINGWNRLNVAFRTEPGRYTPGMVKKMQAELVS